MIFIFYFFLLNSYFLKSECSKTQNQKKINCKYRHFNKQYPIIYHAIKDGDMQKVEAMVKSRDLDVK